MKPAERERPNGTSVGIVLPQRSCWSIGVGGLPPRLRGGLATLW